MNFGHPPGGFPWSQFWDEEPGNSRAQPTNADNTPQSHNGDFDDMSEQYQAMLRSWGMPWLNVPHRGGPPHRGPPPFGPPPHHGRPHRGPPRDGSAPPPPPPPGHGGPPPPGPPPPGPPPPGPPPPGPRGPHPPPEHEKPDKDRDEGRSRPRTPPTPGTPPEELPEYPGLPHRHRHHHGRHGKGKQPRHWAGPSWPRDNDADRSRDREHCRAHKDAWNTRHGNGQSPLPFWMNMIMNNAPAEQRKTMEENFANIFNWSEPKASESNTDGFTPEVDIFDKAGSIVIFASLPGAKKSDLDVTYNLTGHSVTISGVVARPDEVDEEMMQALKEGGRKIGYFTKTVTLPGSYIDSDEMTAKLEDGVLRVEIPKPSDSDWEEVKKVPIL
ncbi:Heat shock protein 16 [Sphaceloma murrayae]|uniref:Heat shock protein 16 n=1 Tax=Sphaceloma murrayae TaxID=2082308 RepID=A0A2K1QTV9_9PEZI|nr:Heat shock protein 16 [Sphaceloma murrayae]